MQPANSYQLSAGLTSGLRQRQGFDAHCYFDANCSKKAIGQNDLPQLPHRMPALWETPQRSSQIPLQAVPQNVH
jgi:hypothetical protein